MSRMGKILIGGLVIAVLMLSSFAAGWAANTAIGGPSAAQTEASVPESKVFWEAWNLVQDHYVDPKEIQPRRMIYGAISGMLATLRDEGHTRFLSPDDVKIQETNISGRFAGIGAHVSQRDGLTILVPMPDSPAMQAGLRSGDVLAKVDGLSISDLSLDQIVSKIRGDKGTKVTLTVYHAGAPDPVDVTITRDEIEIPAVSWTLLPGTKLAWIQVSQFSSVAHDQLTKAIQEARDQGVQGWIVDMRNNPGGLLDQAISVTSEFLPSGTVVIQADRSGKQTPLDARPGGKATDLPLAVLINQQTASAAEIFSGAIQDNHRGQLIGQPTFGTGTVLSTYSLSDGSALLLGTSQWLTPNGQTIKGNGIQPDRKVELALDGRTLNPDEIGGLPADKKIGDIDSQLAAAIEVVSGLVQGQ